MIFIGDVFDTTIYVAILQQGEKVGRTVLAENKTEWKTPSSEPKLWQAFPDEPQPLRSLSAGNTSKSVGNRSDQQNKKPAQLTTEFDNWGFGTDSFSAMRAGSPQMTRHADEGNNSQAKSTFESKSASQPAGWAGF